MKSGITKKILMVGVSSIAFTIAGCGDKSTSGNEDKNNVHTVSTKARLPECDKSIYGDIYFVEKENTYYTCVDDFWEKTEDVPENATGSSSSTTVNEGDTAKVETIAVDSVNVTGFAHKGPFVDGSAVSITGLDSTDAKALFKGKVAGDSGYFLVKNVSLKNQFALVSVYGNYMNEVSGKKSSAKTTLEALMDLSKDSTVNVTLFSHLAAARARELVDVQGFNYNAAMDKAYDELALAVSGLVALSRPELADSLKSLNFKKANLNGGDLTTAALYAVSILMQADLSLSGYVKRLNAVAASFAESGDLSKILKEVSAMADYASFKDSANGYAALRLNAEKFNLAESVPDFENILYTFWIGQYGLGECTADLEETTKENTDELSENFGLKYVCTSKRWHKATELEQKIGLCIEKTSGKISKAGEDSYYCENGEWHLMTALERNLGLCRDSTAGKIGEFDNSKYYCEKNVWNEMTDIEKSIGLCRDSTEKSFGDAEGAYYYCDGEAWQSVNEVEYNLKSICSDTTSDLFQYAVETIGSKFTLEKYYYCDSKKWTQISFVEYQLEKFCSTENHKEVAYTGDSAYYCEYNADNNGFVWRLLTKVEEKIGICNQGIKDSVGWTGKMDAASFRKPLPDTTDKDGKYYACNGTEWVSAERSEYWYGLCDSRNEGEYMDWGYLVNASRDSVTLVNGNVITAIAAAAAVLATLGEDNATLYSQCVSGKWIPSTEIDNFTGKVKCAAANKNHVAYAGGFAFRCEYNAGNYAWRQLSYVEEKLGVCEQNIMDSVGWTGKMDAASFRKPLPDTTDKDGKYYACNGAEWVPAERSEYWYGLCDSRNEGEYMDWGYLGGAKRDSVSLINGKLSTAVIAALATISTTGDGTLMYAQCVNGIWTPSSEIDNFLGKAKCNYTSQPVTLGGFEQQCNGSKWINYLRDDRDNQLYRVTKIDGQWWMAENLNYAYTGGIRFICTWEKDDPDYYEYDSTSFCYNNNPSNCNTYGRLYTWSAAMDSAGLVDKNNRVTNAAGSMGCGEGTLCTPNTLHRGVCPKGWHIPTEDDLDNISKRALSSSEWWSNCNSTFNRINTYGFSALPAGNWNSDYYGFFSSLGTYTAFWSTAEVKKSTAWSIAIDCNDRSAKNGRTKYSGLSIRCVKD